MRSWTVGGLCLDDDERDYTGGMGGYGSSRITDWIQEG